MAEYRNILEWNKAMGYANPQSYPSNFVGPTRPGDYVGGVNPYNGERDPRILGAQAPTNGGGGGAPTNQSFDASPQQRAAEEAARAALAAENSAFDYNREQLNNQLGSLEGQKAQSMEELELGLSGVRSQVGTSKKNTEASSTRQVQEAGSIANSTQRQNRNVLRALGIINSSAGGELLSKPLNEFDKQRATIQQAAAQRFGELDDFLNQKVAEANTAKQGIIRQYTDLVGKIQSDLRFNERSRIDAVRSANAALQQRLADIQTSVMNFNQQVQSQKQNFAQGLAQQMNYTDPTVNRGAFNNLSLTTPQAQVQQVGLTPGVVPDERKKKQAGTYGLLSTANA